MAAGKIVGDEKLDFQDVLLLPRRNDLNSRAEVELCTEYTFLHSSKRFRGVPIFAANMDTVGTFPMAKALAAAQLLTAVHKHYTVDEWTNFASTLSPAEKETILKLTSCSAGTSPEDRERVRAILDAIPEIEMLTLDVANGYSDLFVNTVRKYREEFGACHSIIAGNCVTPEMVRELLREGADVVKVGIGPGSVCTTRKQAGVGYPQLSAVLECAEAAHDMGGHIVSDGGCTCPGDVAKAFAGGADFVMLGGLLAGHTESGGTLIEMNGKRFKMFYGMASKTAQEKHNGGLKEYRASEGKTVTVPYRGDVNRTIAEILGGVRSACTYVGAHSLQELKGATFIKVRRQLNEVFSAFNTED